MQFLLTTASDQSLVARIREGDESAATCLYERYARRVLSLVQTQMGERLRTECEPEDIVQSVFRSIFRGLNAGGYDAPDGGTLWQLMAVIAVHKIRRAARRGAAAKRDVRRTQSLDALTASLSEVAAPEEIEQAAREILEGLSPSEQRIVTLRLQGFSVEEISDKVQRSRRTVERMLQRIRRVLADMLDGDP